MVHHNAYGKYIYYLKKYATFQKLNNILLNKKEFYLKKTTLSSFPYKITIDPASYCNLRCPACHTGTKFAGMIKPSFLKFNDFKTILDQVKNYSLSVALYNWGEPFLNKEIFDMISYATENKVGTTMHSNFNHFNEKMAEELVKSGLTHIYLSIDGATQEVYEKYRVNGNLEDVLNNIKILNEVKKKYKSKYPLITWKYLTFGHNMHEVEAALKLATSYQVDNFKVFPANPKLKDIYDEAAEYNANQHYFSSLKDDCKSLWASIYVSPDGTVFPCSLSLRESEAFGNMLKQDISEIWNNSKYTAARSLFTGKFSADDIPYPCKGCKYFMRECGPCKPLS